MAIVFLFNVLVVRKNEIDAKYPGGLAQFRLDWMTKPKRWREDEHLLFQSSMGGDFFKNVTERLRSLGVKVLLTDESVPPAKVVERCGWLDWDIYERLVHKSPDGFVQTHEVARFWLRGTEPGDTADFRPPK